MLNDPRSPKHFLTFMNPVKITEIERVRADLEADPSIHLLNSPSVRETAGRFLLFRSGAIVTYVTTKDDVRALTEFARMLRSKIQAGKLKVIVFTQFDLPNLSKLVRALGCFEFKVPKGQGERVKLTIRGLLSSAQVCEKLEAMKKEEGAPAASTTNGLEITRTPAIKTNDDCWMIDFGSFQKVGDQYGFTAIGPSLALGDWQEVTTPVDSVPCWKFIRQDPGLDEFISSGHWIFNGAQPEYRNSLWYFSSPKPELVYVAPDGKPSELRVSLSSPTSLAVTENPDLSHELTQKLMMSLDFSVYTLNPKRTKSSFTEFCDQALSSKDNQVQAVPLNERISKAKRAEYEEYEKVMIRARDTITPDSDDDIIRELLDEITGTGVPILIWTQQKHIKDFAPHLKFYVKSNQIEVPYPPSDGESSFAERLLHAASEQLFVSAGLRRSAVFFSIKSNDVEFAEKSMLFPPPESIYQIQRRKAFRLPIAHDHPFLINVRNVGELRVRDISHTGLCIIHPGFVDPQVLFPGQILPELAIEIDNQVLQCPAEIRWIKAKHTAEGTPFAEIGAQFFELSPSIAELIRLYVFEESLKYLQKYVRIG